MGMIRDAVVAGMFYPGEPDVLSRDIRRLLDAVPTPSEPAAMAKAIIAPHAGYIYSGPMAAQAYARVAAQRAEISRVVLLGPSHRVAFGGVAACSADAYRTPLGQVPVDRDAVAKVLSVPGVSLIDAAHAQEHSLEVHVPFLQTVLDRFSLVPLVAGDASADLVAEVLEAVWGGSETLIVISSDLSHYLDYARARSIDEATRGAIERLDAVAVGHEQACGCVPIGGLLTLAKRRRLSVETIGLCNSGDTAGPRDRVVGYGAWMFSEAAAKAEDDLASRLRAAASQLLALARSAIEEKLGLGRSAPQAELPPVAGMTGACFVTLKQKGQLRGCIGSPEAWRPLATDIADNAVKAAFRDPRFSPVRKDELAGLTISLSVLSPPEPMAFADEADLLAQLRPGIDGLIVGDGLRRALFLPAVWESLPQPRDFLLHLKRKAGLPDDHWSASLTARRFTAIELKAE